MDFTPYLSAALAILCASLVVRLVPLFVGRRESTREHVHADINPLLLKSGLELGSMVCQGEVTSAHLTELCIEQLKRVNPALNAIVATRFKEALKEAKDADRRVAAARRAGTLDELPPFIGVPCTVKECFEVKDMPYTTGLVKRKGIVGKETCAAVKRLQRAGAVVLGVGNTSEACMWMESANHVYGRTSNPYDLDRTVGGSSGGNGAAVSACIGPFAIGSDVGGSIRIPALFNGIFGHKPTGGAVPNSGTYPPCHGDVQRFCQLGPMARHSRDLMPLLRVVAGSHEGDDQSRDIAFGDPEAVDVSSLKIYNCYKVMGGSKLASARDPCNVKAHEEVVAHLKSLGCEVVDVDYPELGSAFDVWSSILGRANPVPFRKLISEGKNQIWVLWEIVKCTVGISDHTLPALGLALVERGADLTPARVDKMVELGNQLRNKLQSDLGDNAVLLYPSLPRLAPKHMTLLPNFPDSGATAIFNVMELPVTAVPLGLSRNGLPMGIQVVAGSEQDHISIAVAQALEDRFGGWVPPRE